MIAGQTPITRNKSLATVRKLMRQYSIHVEFMIPKLFSQGIWHNMYHATVNNDIGLGSRIPSINIIQENGNLSVQINSDVNGDYRHAYLIPTERIQLKTWITINISQTKVGGDFQYGVELNGELLHMVKNTQPQAFDNVKIYISDPWIPALPGYVRNVYIKGKV